VTVPELAALMRRHTVALMIIVVATAGLAFAIERTPVTYQESGTLAFTARKTSADPNPYASLNDALIDAAGVLTVLAVSPQSHEQVKADGGTALFNIALVNGYNLQFPDFNEPYATLNTTSGNVSAVIRTFTLVIQLLHHELEMRQSQVHVRGADRIVMHVLAVTGPAPQLGSFKRVFGGLFALMLVLMFSVAIFLDRHPIRLKQIAYFRRPYRVGRHAHRLTSSPSG
jgi:hypothetical protein